MAIRKRKKKIDKNQIDLLVVFEEQKQEQARKYKHDLNLEDRIQEVIGQNYANGLKRVC